MASVVDQRRIVSMARSTNREHDRKTVLLEVAYRLHVGRVYTLCMRLLASVRNAEEATIMVFARFSRELTRHWDESVVARRLRELAIDEALQRLWRSRERLGCQPAAVGTLSAAFFPPLTKTSDDVAPRLLDPSTINEVIARLPDDLRITFVLHDVEGLNYKDIGKYLRVREAEVRALIISARLEVRRLWLSPS